MDNKYLNPYKTEIKNEIECDALSFTLKEPVGLKKRIEENINDREARKAIDCIEETLNDILAQTKVTTWAY